METRELEKLLQKYLYGYQKAINEGRSIPDAKTGLKIVHQRVLWACLDGGYTSNKEYKKSARIVGDIIGKFHPHGDEAAYQAMVRLAQPWKMRYPLIDLYGNMGNIDGDGPAAMRYTNARLAKLAEDGMLLNIKKKNVDFVPNYDEDENESEPYTLPAIFPNLLCNPNDGIGWAMACEWLPHNLNEVAAAINDFLDGKEPTLPGPDFPTGGQIINQKEIEKFYKTGKGTVRIRARYKIDKDSLVFYEIPYGTTTEGIIDKIKEVAQDIPEIREISNSSGLIIRCAKGTSLDAIAQKLYAKTPLQTTASFNQVALVNDKPKLLNLKECIEIYVAHNIDCYVRELNYDLNIAVNRLHIINGLLVALEDIDNVIALIKKSDNSAAAKTALIEKYSLDEDQAKAILAMRLSSLAHMEKIELENEKRELVNRINEINTILANRDLQVQEIRNRLNLIVKKYGDKRRTELTNITVAKEDKEIEEVVPEDVVVVLTKNGDIKRIPTNSFRVQRRGGKGVKTADETVLDIISTNTIDNLLFFSNKGKMYKTVVDNVPVGTNISKGTRLATLINLEPGEDIIAMTSLYRKTSAKYVMFFTKNGLLKKTLLSEYTGVKRSTGIQAIKLAEDDAIANVTFVENEEVIVFTKNGMSIHFETEPINAIGRVAAGVKSIKLDDDDEVVCGLPIHNKNDKIAIIVTSGLGKKVGLDEFPIQGRGGKGVKCATDSIVGVAAVNTGDTLLLNGIKNTICIDEKDIPLLGRTAVGNILIKDIVKTVVKV